VKESEEQVPVTSSLEAAVKGKNCVVVMTNHRAYGGIDLNWLKETLATPVIVDGRNIFKPEACKKAGFAYRGVGVGKEEDKI
jgi:UDPglucose 6-dehydrogenase